MNTYTAFCRDAGELHGTIWIEAIEAANITDAKAVAENECAAAWSYEDSTSIECIGLAEGDIKILYWND